MNLAHQIRPQTLDEFFGQEHLVGEGKLLQKMITTGNLSSIILWGPPGSGKTTLAHLIARGTKANFHHLSAVETGKADLLKIIKQAEEKNKKPNTLQPTTYALPTILFIDEIHRWNKAQQDTLLPYVESGLITLIGATTENPSFEIISALLSRSRVFVLKSLDNEHLDKIINRALTDKEKGVGASLVGAQVNLTPEARELLIRLSGGDARVLLNALELAVQLTQTGRPQGIAPTKRKSPSVGVPLVGTHSNQITIEHIKEIFQIKSGLYDKNADEHYNTISSYIKSMRASNVDAAIYYLARMVVGGEDAKFIARRMVIFASEDIGMAQPTALVVANEVFRACETIGYPECAINLAHGTVYLAKAKKDRSAYDAYNQAVADVKNFPNEPIPLNLRNAPTNLMKTLNYGKDYEMYTKENLLPEKLKGRKYYKEKPTS